MRHMEKMAGCGTGRLSKDSSLISLSLAPGPFPPALEDPAPSCPEIEKLRRQRRRRRPSTPAHRDSSLRRLRPKSAASESTTASKSASTTSFLSTSLDRAGTHSFRSPSLLFPLFMLFLVLLPSPTVAWRQRHPERRQCEHITIPMCRGIGYNLTYMPNQFNHETQEEAGLEVHQFWPLVEIQCSPHLRFFLCSMYAPICIPNYVKPLPACRNVCEQAKQGCAPIMRQYGFAWPERMNCDGLPEYGDSNNLCMGWEYNATNDGSTPPPNVAGGGATPPSPSGGAAGGSGGESDSAGKCRCSCRDNLVPLTREDHAEVFDRGIVTGSVPNCAKPCRSMYFNDDERAFVSFWIGLWAILCGLSTLLTCLTFFIDMERFQYPERPIIFMSGCYLMVSVGYVVRLAVGHQEIACSGDIVRYNATGPAICTCVFILIYFFGMAACIWWVCLSFTWFLAAGLKWGSEAIASYSQYFHLAAWFLPAVKTVAVLAMSSVDGDPVSGICYVGNQDVGNLRGFVLAPHCVYLVVGILFLLAGFVSLFRIRSVIKRQGHGRTDKLEKLMIRIGIFTVLYTVPASIVIACLFYEQYYREAWEHAKTCSCDDDASALDAVTAAAPLSRRPLRPDYAVFMLKYFMCLVVGITSGFWIWSGKTVESWRKFYMGSVCRRGGEDCARVAGGPNSPSPAHQLLYCKSITPPPSKNLPVSHV